MKILFVASIYGHLTAFHVPYMKYFQSQGYEVWAAAVGQESKEGKEVLEALNVKCVDIPFSRSPLGSQNIEAYRTLKKLFETEIFELVHVHTPVASILTRAAFRKSKQGKIVYTAHGFHFFKGAPKQNWLIYYTAEKLAAKWTDHLITINDEDYKNAHSLLPKEKISIVHGVGVKLSANIIDEADKLTLKKQLGLSEKSVVISCVAELNNNKNHLFLLQNWKSIKQICPDFELLFIGEGEKEQELKQFVVCEKLNDIHFLGTRRDVPKLLQLSDISTLLSHREGLPRSVMEAMAAGLPCVVTNTRGLRDLIKSNDSGFVVNHGENHSLIEAFTKLYEENLRKELGMNAKKAVEPFLIENVLEEYKVIYEKLLK